MKRILLACMLAAVVASCSKKDDPTPVKQFYLKPNKMVLIKPSQGVTLKSGNLQHLTALEIVTQCIGISFQNIPTFGNQQADCGFADAQRDITSNPPMLKRWATDLINVDGFGKYYLVPDLIYAENIVYFRAFNGKRDTIAYTPNSVMRNMEADIKAALAAQDTTLAYKVFNDAMTFTPITGAEWRVLKAQGKQ